MTRTEIPGCPPFPAPASRALTVAVFCGARSGYDPLTTIAAGQLGAALGLRGHALIYGAGGSGLMGTLAWAASKHGARIIGYAPQFIYEREIGIAAPEQDLHITTDMFERKRLMIERADAFIALPGGYGTVDEVLDVISLNYLGVTPKPLVLLDVDAFWQRLSELAAALQGLGFATSGEGSLFRVTSDPITALDIIETTAALSTPNGPETEMRLNPA
jgi:uncharacterized protein (TIGR00730 family)